ncbi:hypothetical protein OEZ86_004832 [Tetradesmus obliquus]|nr:hypothetical protein OEZ86_004832 [Tetradesmus obliquus]
MPSARRKIFLQFQGCVTQGTAWNALYTNGRPIATPMFKTDSDPSSISNAEGRLIIAMWRAVAEYFAIWEVDVTTEDPGFATLERLNEDDEQYGVRGCIGGTAADWYGKPVSGLALQGTFGVINSNKSSSKILRDFFVFQGPDKFSGPLDFKFTSRAIVHEIGHTLGLSHDGDATSEYFAGDSIWGPVMGMAQGEWAQWSNGTYPPKYGPGNNLEDDLAIISRTLPRLPVELGSDAATARQLCSADIPCSTSGTTRSAQVAARCSTATDRDYYSVTIDAATPTTVLVTIAYSPTLLILRPTNASSQSYVRQSTRRSSLRLELQAETNGLRVERNGPSVNEWSDKHHYKLTAPGVGTYTFWLVPTVELQPGSSQPNRPMLPTTYGNVGSYTMTVTLRDAGAANNPPVAQNDTITIRPDYPYMITSDVLLANDSDLDGDPFRVVRVRSADTQYGKITQIDDVNWAYFPSRGANGVAELIRYTVTDSVTEGSTVEGWLSLVIAAYNEPNRSPVAAPAAFSISLTPPGGASTSTSSIDFNIANYVTDPDGDFLIFEDPSKPLYGFLEPLQLSSQFANTWWRYTATPEGGTSDTGAAVAEQLTYVVTDARGAATLGTVNITVIVVPGLLPAAAAAAAALVLPASGTSL